MDIEKIRELRLAHPFKPFNLILTDGRKLPVDKPYYLAFSPTKRALLHVSVGGGFETFPPSAVREVDFKNPEAVRKRNGKSRRQP
jgi:hypothetical protein